MAALELYSILNSFGANSPPFLNIGIEHCQTNLDHSTIRYPMYDQLWKIILMGMP